jgi:hypothetical protein
MNTNDQHAYHEGKLARWTDERNQASGSFSRCPYRTADRVRAWNKGYQDQSIEFQPKAEADAEADERRASFVAAIEGWLVRNK